MKHIFRSKMFQFNYQQINKQCVIIRVHKFFYSLIAKPANKKTEKLLSLDWDEEKYQNRGKKEALMKHKHQQHGMKASPTQVKLSQILVKKYQFFAILMRQKNNHELWYFFTVSNQSET